jgi:hypothetical protein
VPLWKAREVGVLVGASNVMEEGRRLPVLPMATMVFEMVLCAVQWLLAKSCPQ